jgi:RNA-directed DNA polymerase
MSSYYSKLCQLSHLRLAWRRISKTNKFSRGFDDQTIKNFGDYLEDNLEQISSELRNRNYEFRKARGLLIVKQGGGKRPLKIPAVRDRVVLKGIELLISPRLRGYDLPCSFGYVPNKSVPDAIRRVRQLANEGNTWVLEADIKKFFDSVDRPLLIDAFARKIRMSSLTPLIKSSLQVELGNPEDFTPEDRDVFPDADSGIPQGGVLSPLLANFYLHPFDAAMMRAGFNLVRYADDFVVLCRTQAEADRAYRLCLQVIEGKLNLRMHHLGDSESKTRIAMFSKGFSFLGMQFQGASVLPTSKKIRNLREKIESILDLRQGLSLLRTLTKLSNLLHGWANAYEVCDNSSIFAELDAFVREKIGAFLQAHALLQRGWNLTNRNLKFLGIPSIVSLRGRARGGSSADPHRSSEQQSRANQKQ